MSKIPEAQIGSILMIDFSSSTLWTVARFQRFGGAFESLASSSVTIAALSNHLQRHHREIKEYNKFYTLKLTQYTIASNV